jgi:hypothetical protein
MAQRAGELSCMIQVCVDTLIVLTHNKRMRPLLSRASSASFYH